MLLPTLRHLLLQLLGLQPLCLLDLTLLLLLLGLSWSLLLRGLVKARRLMQQQRQN
jgi:hypothetical protein